MLLRLFTSILKLYLSLKVFNYKSLDFIFLKLLFSIKFLLLKIRTALEFTLKIFNI